MLLVQQEYAHPRQASRVRLKLYRYQPPAQEHVSGLLPRQEGFLLTEERAGTSTVVASLGFFGDEGPARQRLAARADELARQGYGTVSGS